MSTIFSNKNKFGDTTYKIYINTFWRVDIHETNSPLYIIEFKEIGLFSNRIHFSIATNKILESTIIEAFDRVYSFFLLCPKYTWSIDKKLQKQKEALFYLKKDLNKKTTR